MFWTLAVSLLVLGALGLLTADAMGRLHPHPVGARGRRGSRPRDSGRKHSTIRYAAAVVLSTLASGSVAGAAPLASSPKVIDYELAFTEAFPVSGGEHRVTDWAFYSALVTGDLVTYGKKIDPSIAKRADSAKGKPYQTQQVEMTIKGDARLVAAFNDQRRRIQAMVLYVDGDGFAKPEMPTRPDVRGNRVPVGSW